MLRSVSAEHNGSKFEKSYILTGDKSRVIASFTSDKEALSALDMIIKMDTENKHIFFVQMVRVFSSAKDFKDDFERPSGFIKVETKKTMGLF